jgi:hypothetical protein
MKKVAAEADELCDYMQDIKVEMVTIMTDEDDKAIDDNGNIDMESIYYETGSYAAEKIIVERDKYKLYNMLSEYSKHALELTNNKALTTYIKTATKNHYPYKLNDKLSAEEVWAAYCILVDFPRTLNTLSMYQSTVRMIEYQMLTELQSSGVEIVE